MIRRIRVQQNTLLEDILSKANVPHEPDRDSKMTTVFEFPVYTGEVPCADEISIWEQAMNVVLLQREWTDNSVSNTLYFSSDSDVRDLEAVLSAIAPLTKSVSLSRHAEKGTYPQMPEEGISREEYERRVNEIKSIDWRGYNIDSVGTKFCDSEACEIN